MQLKELIEGCRRLDPQAQRELYDQYRRKLWATCLRYVREPLDADDIFQEAFLRIFRQIHTLKDELALDAWVRKIVVRTAINSYKAQQKYWQQELADTSLHLSRNEEEELIDRLSNDQLLQLIQQLPDAYRMVFNLYEIDGFSHAEIGELLGISEPTSRANLSRSKAWLRNEAVKQKIYFE